MPQAWRGLWRRVALERADGSGDIDSLVLWLQTETLFVDLRVPAGRPACRDFDPAMAAQEGFAGRLLHDGDRARWDRRIDFRPLGVPDEGRLDRQRRMMTEHGLHDRYVEHWWQVAAGDDVAVLVDTPRRIVVRAGPHVMLADERRPDAPDDLAAAAVAAGDLAAAVAVGPGLAPLLDCEVSHAVSAGDGWRITASTLPWRQGLVLTARDLQGTLAS